jgi:hypothetical protein
MKGDILLQNVRMNGFIPAAGGKNAKEGKRKIKEGVETKLGKNIDSVRKRCDGKPLCVSITFFLKKGSTHTKKDLVALSNVILSVLSEEMSTGKDAESGLDIIKNDSQIYKITCEKKITVQENDVGFTFSIYEWAES